MEESVIIVEIGFCPDVVLCPLSIIGLFFVTIHQLVCRRSSVRVNRLCRWFAYKGELFSSLVLTVIET